VYLFSLLATIYNKLMFMLMFNILLYLGDSEMIQDRNSYSGTYVQSNKWCHFNDLEVE